MTSNDMKNQIREQLGDSLTAELGPTLEIIGRLAKEIWWEDHGVYLTADERNAKKKEPMTTSDDVSHIAINVGDRQIALSRSDETKPAVSIPYGQADRMTQASLPKDWMMKALYQFIIDCDGGDTTYAQQVADFINQWIDIATIDNGEGSIKIDKDKLPAPSAEVFTTELVDSHKRKTRSRAKGSTSFNISLSVSANDNVPLRIPVKTTGFTAPLGIQNAPLVPSPAGASQKPTDTLGTGEDSDGFPVPVGADPSLSTNALLVDDEWKASGVLREIIGLEPLTKGAIRKAVADRVPEPMWVAELERMVKAGEVMSTGERRSTRYTMCEVGA